MMSGKMLFRPLYAPINHRKMKKLNAYIDKFEEITLALLLVAMVLIAFSQVVARYLFNSGWHGALEITGLLFAWMILFGMSYGIRVNAHLGVDATALLPSTWFRRTSLFATFCCIFWAAILFDSSWIAALSGTPPKGGAFDYVSKMYRFGLELEDLPVQRWLAYIILPIALVLFIIRCLQAAYAIATGKRASIIATHENQTPTNEDAS